MKTKESDIIFECGDYWVFKGKLYYIVYRNVGTHARVDCAFALNEDGLSLAIARCKYMGNRHGKETR